MYTRIPPLVAMGCHLTDKAVPDLTGQCSVKCEMNVKIMLPEPAALTAQLNVKYC